LKPPPPPPVLAPLVPPLPPVAPVKPVPPDRDNVTPAEDYRTGQGPDVLSAPPIAPPSPTPVITGAAGATVSTAKVKAVEAGPVLPAASVAVGLNARVAEIVQSTRPDESDDQADDCQHDEQLDQRKAGARSCAGVVQIQRGTRLAEVTAPERAPGPHGLHHGWRRSRRCRFTELRDGFWRHVSPRRPLCGPHSQRREAGRPSSRAVHQVELVINMKTAKACVPRSCVGARSHVTLDDGFCPFRRHARAYPARCYAS
jgi:hypothetical protein